MVDEAPRVIPFDHGGLHFELHVRQEPSGLAGRVFHGHEQVAGIRLFHLTDPARLLALVTRDRAFLRAVQRLAQHTTGAV